MWNQLGDWWCRKMHTEAMWPIHGRYICKRCFREHPVEWEGMSETLRVPGVQPDAPVWLAEHR